MTSLNFTIAFARDRPVALLFGARGASDRREIFGAGGRFCKRTKIGGTERNSVLRSGMRACSRKLHFRPGSSLCCAVRMIMTCLDHSLTRQERLAKQREAYHGVVLKLVQKLNASPGAWLHRHTPQKKAERKALEADAMKEMEKILGSFHVDIKSRFGQSKFKVATAEKCGPLLKGTKGVDANGGVRPTKTQKPARSVTMAARKEENP